MPGDSGAQTMCVDRSLPACQPKVIGPAGALGTGLTVIGNDAYWRQRDKPTVMLRTSLQDDQTTELALAPDGLPFFDETPYLFNDGTNVFGISLNCCAGIENGLFGYYVSDRTWKFTDLLRPLPPTGFLYAAGSLLIVIDRRHLLSFAPADLMPTKTFNMPPNQYAGPLGTDGTTIYMEVASNETYQLATFDGVMPMPFANAPAASYGTDARLAVDGTNVYFTANTQVMSADRTTAPKELVDVAPLYPLHIFVDQRAVYWVDDTGLYAIGKADAKRVTVATFADSSAVRQIDQNADYVVWTGADGLSKVRK
jgi:hypothetical protein